MAEILSHLTSASSELRSVNNTRDERYDTQIRDLVAYIKNCDKNSDTQYLLDVSTARIFTGESGRAWLVGSYARWYKPCLRIWPFTSQNLHPSLHTLSYLLILNLHIDNLQIRAKENLPDEIKPGNDLWTRVAYFLQHFDPIQVRYAGHEWRRLVELLAQAAEVTAKVGSLQANVPTWTVSLLYSWPPIAVPSGPSDERSVASTQLTWYPYIITRYVPQTFSSFQVLSLCFTGYGKMDIPVSRQFSPSLPQAYQSSLVFRRHFWRHFHLRCIWLLCKADISRSYEILPVWRDDLLGPEKMG